MKLTLTTLVSVLAPSLLVAAASAQAPATDPAAAPAAAPAADAPVAEPESPTAKDEAAIRKNAEGYDAAFNARDAKALAALWSPEAIYSDPDTGEEIVGREALEKYFTDLLKDNDSKLKVDVTSVEFVSPNVAIEQGVAHVISPDGAVEESNYSAVHVRQNGGWLLDRVTEEGVVKPPKSNYEHLKDLEWMVGSWIDEDANDTVQTDVDWTKNKNFLTRSFSATIGDQVDMSGMQIIGWDPAGKRIRSWVFDSDGGFGEGQWTKKADRWVIQYSGTLPDGSKMTGVNILTPIDDDAYGWQSINREIDGEILPNIDEVVIVRADAFLEAEAADLDSVDAEYAGSPSSDAASVDPAPAADAATATAQ